MRSAVLRMWFVCVERDAVEYGWESRRSAYTTQVSGMCRCSTPVLTLHRVGEGGLGGAVVCRVVATRATQRVRGAAAALFYRARSVAFTPPDRDVTSTPSTVLASQRWRTASSDRP